jgi:hypothetical protein
MIYLSSHPKEGMQQQQQLRGRVSHLVSPFFQHVTGSGGGEQFCIPLYILTSWPEVKVSRALSQSHS